MSFDRIEWHSHGFAMALVARDGRPLRSAAHFADTFSVNAGKRRDAVLTAERLDVWAFHCHEVVRAVTA